MRNPTTLIAGGASVSGATLDELGSETTQHCHNNFVINATS